MIVYVNGEYVRDIDAKVSVFDRGYMFGDSVYEVSAVVNGKLIDNDYHTERLHRSLKELSMTCPFEKNEDLYTIQKELLDKNNLREGIIYLQVTRGASMPRSFLFPPETNTKPSLVLIPQKVPILDNPLANRGAKVLMVEEIRWNRRDIKTTQLLAQSLAKQAAHDANKDDAWMYEPSTNFVTEASSANAYIITQDDVLITRHLGNHILSGITRKVVLSLATKDSSTIKDVIERPFTIEEAQNAKEAFSTSASSFVMPVVEINDMKIGDGTPGPFATQLRQAYIDRALAFSSS
jgi:D-alanine transaminase